jgi:hypothetical protein
VEFHLFALRLHGDEPRHEGGAVSVGSCGPFGDGDDFDVDAAYDAMCIECDALRVENRLLMRELKKMREVLRDIAETLQKLTEEKK